MHSQFKNMEGGHFLKLPIDDEAAYKKALIIYATIF